MRFVLICVLLCFNFLNSEQKGVLEKDDEEKLHDKNRNDILNDENALKDSLMKVIRKIDIDNDGDISLKEMKVWFDGIQNEAIHREFNQRWLYLEYALRELNFPELNWEAFNSIANPVSEIERQHRRWSNVDENKDGLLSKEEFFAFLFPRFTQRYSNVELRETMEIFDRDFDGKLNFPEFYRYIIYNRRRELDPFTPTERQGTEEEYKAYFDKVADVNKDGFLDENELRMFLFGDQSAIAAQHLLHNHDEDKSGKLSAAEILKHPQHFTRILPHEFWDALNSRRDEL